MESDDQPIRVRVVVEYDWITYRAPKLGTMPADVRDKFNTLGYEGWDVVDIEVLEYGYFLTTYRAMFKRTKIIEEA